MSGGVDRHKISHLQDETRDEGNTLTRECTTYVNNDRPCSNRMQITSCSPRYVYKFFD